MTATRSKGRGSAVSTERPERLRPIAEIEREPGYEWATLRWLRRQVYEHRLTSYRVGSRVLIDLDDLDEMVLSGRRPAERTA
ncbi:MAG: hypothetical protein U5R31_13740 [Acidimicrobiia bacterium]|nr:hypothetical protein [Acidimicrobiia bacterium]